MKLTHEDEATLHDVEREFGVSLADLRSKSRTRNKAAARAALWTRLRDASARRGHEYSYPELGELLGKDHTSVIVAVRKARAKHSESPKISGAAS